MTIWCIHAISIEYRRCIDAILRMLRRAGDAPRASVTRTFAMSSTKSSAIQRRAQFVEAIFPSPRTVVRECQLQQER